MKKIFNGTNLGIAGLILSLAGTVISSISEDKKLDDRIAKEVAKQLSNGHK